jgi:hypothetical protein
MASLPFCCVSKNQEESFRSPRTIKAQYEMSGKQSSSSLQRGQSAYDSTKLGLPFHERVIVAQLARVSLVIPQESRRRDAGPLFFCEVHKSLPRRLLREPSEPTITREDKRRAGQCHLLPQYPWHCKIKRQKLPSRRAKRAAVYAHTRQL